MAQNISLPIDEFLPRALENLRAQPNLVVTAAPGAGKTTRLPAFLAKHATGKVLVLEPRRMAAMAAAQRVAEEQSWTLGQEVGYQVRFANKASSNTKLIFLTEALLSRKLAADPELQGVEYVVLDEFHERSLHVDIALGLLRELQELGSAIKLVVMSATLEAEKISEYLNQAPILDVPGKLFPLEIKYQKNSQILLTSSQFFETLFATLKEAERATDKDILVFLPGVGEIDRASDMFSTWADEKKIQIVPLHGSLQLEAQRSALQRGSSRRVILSTNIAESSVTVDGVGCVIDTGLAKNMKYDLRTGFSRLELGRISKASAQQRSGRAARQFPGVSYRLWNKMDEQSMPGHDLPEIMRAELSESLLFLAAQGVSDFEKFLWFEKPSALHLKKALENLKVLEALDADQKITPLGQEILRWPLPPRLAKLMLFALELGVPALGADVAAILQERDFLLKGSAENFLGDQFEDDIWLRLEILKQSRQGRVGGIHHMGLQTVEQSARQILSYCKTNSDSKKADKLILHKLLLSTFADRLCRRREPNADRALMVGGRGVRIASDSVVRKSEFFIALDGVEKSQGSETMVSRASGLAKDFVMSELAKKIRKKSDLHFDKERGQFYSKDAKHFLDLPLEECGIRVATADEVAEQLPQVLCEEWDSVLKENEPFAEWCERVRFLSIHREEIAKDSLREQLYDLDAEELFSREQKIEAFTMAASGEKDFLTVAKKDLIYFFESLLDSDLVAFLRKELPARLQVPSGSILKVHYPVDKDPYIEVRIQEVFGWTQTPKLFDGKISLILHLLGPNYRPMQVTNDLTSFWQNGYPEVRKELRIRYPKHSWPEDPLTAKAEAKGRPVKNK